MYNDTHQIFVNNMLYKLSRFRWLHWDIKERTLKDGQMVTRFAPSPTGFVHMGSLYASFIDLQMAKQTNGVCILRIEDTDQKREVENGVEGIINDFKNLGITFDEGPSFGGEYGPYVQSERGDIYRAFVRRLIEEDKAYPCFCTPEELDEQRKNSIIGLTNFANISVEGSYKGLRATLKNISTSNTV